jgi:hypothetical protein
MGNLQIQIVANDLNVTPRLHNAPETVGAGHDRLANRHETARRQNKNFADGTGG